MQTQSEHAATHWTLVDLVDFEALLARHEDTDTIDRQYFVHAIRPRLTALADDKARRRVGLHLWLAHGRAEASVSTGQWFGHALNLAGWGLFVLLAFSGMGLVAGLLLGPQQAVHVIIFLGLTLALPWLIYFAGLLLRASGRHGNGWVVLARAAMRLFGRERQQQARLNALLEALTQARATRRVLATTLAGVLQRGAIGFNLGLILAFVGCLLLFDVRFYWEATPGLGMQSVVAFVTRVIAAPWAWFWPQALPSMADIAASRALPGAMSAAGDGSWWRFLLLTLVVWGLLPRLLLWAVCRLQLRRALAQLTFQAPRHRALWRRLNTIERGEVTAGPTDGVLVLDVGGHGVTGDAMRGFLLRRLRVNPLVTLPVAILDAEREAQAEQALAAGPAGVVLLVEGWTLSPRQVEKLHAQLRARLGHATTMIWLVFALASGQPVAPAEGDLQRWTQQIDSLRDPATEVAAYDG